VLANKFPNPELVDVDVTWFPKLKLVCGCAADEEAGAVLFNVNERALGVSKALLPPNDNGVALAAGCVERLPRVGGCREGVGFTVPHESGLAAKENADVKEAEDCGDARAVKRELSEVY